MYPFLSTILVLFFGVHVNALSYPTTKTEGMVGFAKVGGVTGGWSGNVVEINSLADLKKYIGDSTPRVLVINSNITAGTKTDVNLGSNKSIIGSFKKPTLHNIYLKDTTSSGNVILQNLIFQHDASLKDNDFKQLVLKHSPKYWIDHCSFVGHKWSHNDDSEDKILEVSDKADFVTLSNCYIGNHKKGLLIGHHVDEKKTPGIDVHMTICDNFFENLNIRAPGLFRYGHYHVYNNYFRNIGHGFTIHAGSKILSEDNLFENTKHVLDDKGNGEFTDIGSSPAVKGQKSPKCRWTGNKTDATYYNLVTAAQAKTFALASAGAQSSELKFN